MRLIGMMDSPFVRRVAVSLKLMGLPFTHEQTSVFRQYDAFAAINPVVKAPSLVTDDGTVLMDSTLILDYAERLAPAARRLTPTDPALYLRSQHIIGAALAACEKSVQLYYERNLRPADKQHEPWAERVRGQMRAGFRLVDEAARGVDRWLTGPRPMQADVTAAVVWGFARFRLPNETPEADFPALTALAARAEALPEFIACPLE